MAQSTIEQLVQRAFPGISLISYLEPDTVKGYNNRVYFLKVRRSGLSSVFRDSDEAERELVLKINGRFFFENKVQNEVGCIQILGTYCKDIPTPTVFAWSQEGTNVVLSSPLGEEKKELTMSIDPRDETHGGWILMSMLPGKPLSSCNFGDAAMVDIMKQLANVTTSWRTNIPAQKYIGNMQFHTRVHETPPDFVITRNSSPEPQGLVIRGILVDELRITTPIASISQQYAVKMEQKINDLENSDGYLPNRYLVPVLRNFIGTRLPQLNTDVAPYPRSSGNFVFTHWDVSPRNILVTESPPRISGIVDFEFAGFFSPVHEFLNDFIGNEGDWPATHYSTYLEELGRKGIDTPALGIDKVIWDNLYSLEKLSEHIAPWWLPGRHKEAALEEQFAEAARIVEESLAKLN